MNIIDNNSGKIDFRIQKPRRTSVSSDSKLQNNSGDVVLLSSKAIDALKNLHQSHAVITASGMDRTNPLDKLVETGVITKDQQNEVENALVMSKQNQITSAGTYTNKYTKPLDKLVAAGIITPEQKVTIRNAVQASRLTVSKEIKIPHVSEEKNVKTSLNIGDKINTVITGENKTYDAQMNILDSNNNETPMNKLVRAGIMPPDEKASIENLFSA